MTGPPAETRQWFAVPLGFFYSDMVKGASPPVGYWTSGERIFGPFGTKAAALLAADAAGQVGWPKQWLILKGEIVSIQVRTPEAARHE